MVKTRKFVYANVFDGKPKESDFKVVEEELPQLQNGEFLCEALFFTVDPYMRAYARNFQIGMTMIGCQIARILESKNEKFPVNAYVFGNFGWQSHTICNPEKSDGDTFAPYVVPEIPGHPLSLYLGILGMPGNTAYFGFKDCCNPKSGETVVVTGAGGAVGSHVGQIAKIMGCRVIGVTGSEEKGEWLKSIGFDDYINYKTCGDFATALAKLAPKGVDCYFDNVGGEMSSIVIQQMNKYGRIACCGAISSYNDKNPPKATVLQMNVIMNLLTMKGLHASEYTNCWMDGIKQNTEWLLKRQLLYKETVTEGFHNLPKAFIGMLDGHNTGKAIVKV